MKNDKLLHYEKDEGWLHRIRNKDLYYEYPVVYTNGLISHLKSHSDELEAWGIVINGYAISKKPQKMTSSDIDTYCRNNMFFGKNCCLIPLKIMEKIFNNIDIVNDIIEKTNGEPFGNNWYMAQNNHLLSYTLHLDPFLCIIHPLIEEYDDWFISETEEFYFHPAIKL